jgi:hypothetical protein
MSIIHKMLLKNFKCRRHLGRQGLILDDNIKMNVTELGCEGIDRFQLAQEMV